MTPYYQDDAVTIYHADCRDVLPALEPVDLVVTDPPYGIAYASTMRTQPFRLGGIVNDDSFPEWFFEQVTYKSALLVFCRWDKLPTLLPTSLIVWNKLSHSMGNLNHEYGRQWEAIGFYPGADHAWRNGRPKDIIAVPRVPPNQLVHPTEKPIPLLRQLIQHHIGDTILDPFAGSGTSLRAAKDLGHKSIGIEIEERYCEIAAKRMQQLVMDIG